MRTTMTVLFFGLTLALLSGGEATSVAGGGKVSTHVFPLQTNLLPRQRSGKFV